MTASVSADCPTPVPDPQTGIVEVTVADGRNAAIASNADGNFLFVYETNPTIGLSSHAEVKAVRLSSGGGCLGSPAYLVDPHNLGNRFSESLSVAMNADGNAQVAFTTKWEGGACAQITTSSLRSLRFPFGNPLDPFAPPTTQPVALCTIGPADSEPSAAIDAAECWSVAWSNSASAIKGLVVRPCGATTTQTVESCDNANYYCFTSRWRPCVAACDGYVAVVWADAEDPANESSTMNIALRMFDSEGNAASNAIIVNQPSEDPPIEQDDSSQESPAVVLDSAGRLVVVWTGPNLRNCGDQNQSRVFVRHLAWAPGYDPAPMGPEFVADNNAAFLLAAEPNPTVAFAQDPGHIGEYVVMWNTARHIPQEPTEVHARAFDWNAFSLGDEFAVTEATGGVARRLARSAQHTCTWTQQGDIAAAWTADASPKTVYVTILPGGYERSYAEVLCWSAACCRGDLDGNGLVNGDDIETWIKYLEIPLTEPSPPCSSTGVVPCELDLNGDCRFIPQSEVGGSDWAPFICMILDPTCASCADLAPSTCCPPGEAPGPSHPHFAGAHSSGFGNDCNQNGIDDGVDVSIGTSIDCNQNGRPDECDVGFDPRVADANRNFIPDECEADVAAASGAPSTSLDRAAIVQAMDQWWNEFDYHNLKGWQIGYEIKMKLAELGFDLRTAVSNEEGQP